MRCASGEFKLQVRALEPAFLNLLRVERMRIKGLSLLELVVALFIMAVLVAAFQPMVMSYVEQSRQRRAESDLRTVVHAFRLYRRDTSYYPIYSNREDAEADVAVAAELTGPGALPLVAANGWELDRPGELAKLIGTNRLALPTTAALGLLSYQGPYLDLVNPDPWNQTYVITATHLKRSSFMPAFVVSAGPNGILETDRDQTGDPVPGGDDILERLH
jgi:type II secretory pathway pseudopilin PulG